MYLYTFDTNLAYTVLNKDLFYSVISAQPYCAIYTKNWCLSVIHNSNKCFICMLFFYNCRFANLTCAFYISVFKYCCGHFIKALWTFDSFSFTIQIFHITLLFPQIQKCRFNKLYSMVGNFQYNSILSFVFNLSSNLITRHISNYNG